MPKPDWFGESIFFQIANPAAGVNAVVQPDGGTLWHVLSISAAFLAGAAAANRYLYIAHVNGVVDTGLIYSSSAIVAGGSGTYQCSSFYQGQPYDFGGNILFPLGPLCYLNNTNSLRLAVFGIQAADQISSIYVTCERMLEE